MTKYSDFVKSYMAKHGKTWNCAVCEIKKSGAYEKFKKGDTDKKTVTPARNIGNPIPFSVEQASQVKTIAPSPIPAAAPLAEKPAIRQSAPLVMPEILGTMIQDFIRPQKEESKIKRLEEIRSLYTKLAESGKLFTSNFRSKEQREYFKIVRPMLKKELENGYFTADDGKKIYWRVVGVHKRLEFLDKSKTKRGRVIKELKFETFPYQALLFALKARYKWRIGQKLTYELDARVSDIMELAPNLFGKD